MKSIHGLATKIILISFVFFSIEVGAAPLVIGIENQDWYPHYFWKDGKPEGIDVEVVKTIFQRMDIAILLTPLPWKRLIKELEWKAIDGN